MCSQKEEQQSPVFENPLQTMPKEGLLVSSVAAVFSVSSFSKLVLLWEERDELIIDGGIDPSLSSF